MAISAEPRFVLFEQTGSIARITLDRPEKLNAINHETGVQLWAAFARCEDEPSIRAIVLAGAGRAFCAGDELGRDRAPDEELSRQRNGPIKHYVAGPGPWAPTSGSWRATRGWPRRSSSAAWPPGRTCCSNMSGLAKPSR